MHGARGHGLVGVLASTNMPVRARQREAVN